MAYIIVETFHDPPLSDEAWSDSQCKVAPCLQRHQIRWIRMLRSLDRRRTICELDAIDAESVRESYRKAGLSFDRIWTAEVLDYSSKTHS